MDEAYDTMWEKIRLNPQTPEELEEQRVYCSECPGVSPASHGWLGGPFATSVWKRPLASSHLTALPDLLGIQLAIEAATAVGSFHSTRSPNASTEPPHFLPHLLESPPKKQNYS